MATTELGKFLQSGREKNNLTLREVETATGISNAYISQLETGKISKPSPIILGKLCDLYKVSYSFAMNLAGYPALQEDDNSVISIPSSRIGPVTTDEENALLEYLEFLRAKKTKGRK
jgi:HTH-type transcriptional regulator, competence development regulator